MANVKLSGAKIAGVVSAVPSKIFDNQRDTAQFDPVDVKKVVGLAGVKTRHIVSPQQCVSDLCLVAAEKLLLELQWSKESIGALIFVTQTPDYFLPGTSSLMHRDLQLTTQCAVFDVQLGCSGYTYGLWLAHMMIQTGSAKRVLVLQGDTPSKFTDSDDRSTFLLFGDGGTATALEANPNESLWGYSLHSDGAGYSDLIIRGGGFKDRNPEDPRDLCINMNGANLFNFTVVRVPELIAETFSLMNKSVAETDVFLFHQSNQFIMRHIAKKCELPLDKVPFTLEVFGNVGGASVPFTLVDYVKKNPLQKTQTAMMLGYGVGLSWGSAYVELEPSIYVEHIELNIE